MNVEEKGAALPKCSPAKTEKDKDKDRKRTNTKTEKDKYKDRKDKYKDRKRQRQRQKKGAALAKCSPAKTEGCADQRRVIAQLETRLLLRQ